MLSSLRHCLWMIPLAVLSLCACTTLPPAAVRVQLPSPPPPAECTRADLELTADTLTTLPAGFLALAPDARARVLLTLKADDAERYTSLRAVALRCAR